METETESSLSFSRKSVGTNAKQVIVRELDCERDCERDFERDCERDCERDYKRHRSHHVFKLARSLILRSDSRIFAKKRDCSQSWKCCKEVVLSVVL